jgi:hypothetical protein
MRAIIWLTEFMEYTHDSSMTTRCHTTHDRRRGDYTRISLSHSLSVSSFTGICRPGRRTAQDACMAIAVTIMHAAAPPNDDTHAAS